MEAGIRPFTAQRLKKKWASVILANDKPTLELLTVESSEWPHFQRELTRPFDWGIYFPIELVAPPSVLIDELDDGISIGRIGNLGNSDHCVERSARITSKEIEDSATKLDRLPNHGRLGFDVLPVGHQQVPASEAQANDDDQAQQRTKAELRPTAAIGDGHRGILPENTRSSWLSA
jgi:hypothetical protein